MKKPLRAAAAAGLTALTFMWAPAAQAQWIVFDPAN